MSSAPTFPRVLGVLTLGYGAYTAWRPGSLVHAADLEPREAPLSSSGRVLGTVIGTRDVLSGLAMLVAPPGVPLRSAIAARVACDACDVIGFGLAAPPRSRVKVMTVAASWGLLCATSWGAGGRR